MCFWKIAVCCVYVFHIFSLKNLLCVLCVWSVGPSVYNVFCVIFCVLRLNDVMYFVKSDTMRYN